jgi:hypothetical protein
MLMSLLIMATIRVGWSVRRQPGACATLAP